MADEARVTQAGVQALVSGDPAARVTQAGVLTLVRASPAARATQAGVMSLTRASPAARVTQAGVMTLTLANKSARVTQAGVMALVIAGKTPLESEKVYQYRVRANGSAANSAFVESNEESPKPPGVNVTGITVTAPPAFQDRLEVDFTEILGHTLYRLVLVNPFVQFVIDDPTDLPFTRQNLTPGTQYCFVVRPLNGQMEFRTESLPVCATTNQFGPADGPTILSVVPDGYGTITVTWSGPSGASDWDLRHDTDPLFGAPTELLDIGAQTVQINSLGNKQLVYIQVRGKNAGGLGPWGANGNGGGGGVKNATTWPATPEFIQVTQDLSACPLITQDFTWSKGSNTENVDIDQRIASVWSALQHDIVGNGYTHVNAGANVEAYRFRFDNGGWSTNFSPGNACAP